MLLDPLDAALAGVSAAGCSAIVLMAPSFISGGRENSTLLRTCLTFAGTVVDDEDEEPTRMASSDTG